MVMRILYYGLGLHDKRSRKDRIQLMGQLWVNYDTQNRASGFFLQWIQAGFLYCKPEDYKIFSSELHLSRGRTVIPLSVTPEHHIIYLQRENLSESSLSLGLAGQWGQDTDEVSTFLVFLTSHFALAALSSDLTNLGPLMTMKIHLETLKNHGNQPKTMKNHETTLKNHGNQAKTMKPPWKTMETNQKP